VRRVFLERGYEQSPRLVALADLAFQNGVDVAELDSQALSLRARSDRHQGALAEVRPFRYLTLEAVLDHASGQEEPPFLLVLDGVEDPHNLGAILRTADAAGVHGVVVPERRAAPVTPVVGRASAGAVDHVKIAQVGNLTRALEQLKQRRVWIYGLDMDGEQEYDAPDYSGPVAVVAGAEGRGIGRLVREQCDVVVRIPLAGHVESLNVSVATSLALFAVRRSRDILRSPKSPT
jgi:23S rRNA (guanosine2251-2'-O)-methyltransferase